MVNDKDLNKKLNFDVFPESQGGPLIHAITAKAVCFKEAMTDDYKAYQVQVVKNAQAMAETFISRGIKIVSGGTELLRIDPLIYELALANWICDVLAALEDGTSDAVEAAVQAKVVALCETLPVYK